MEKNLLISEEEIACKVAKCAQWLNTEYAGQEVILVLILKGAIVFAADLIRQLTISFQLECVQASSYGMKGTIPDDEVKIGSVQQLGLRGKEVVVVDDIFDRGETLYRVIEMIKLEEPKRVQSLVLLRKKREQKISYAPDYVCFDIEDRFVIGYGLDYKEHFRGLKDIYITHVC